MSEERVQDERAENTIPIYFYNASMCEEEELVIKGSILLVSYV